MVIEKGKAIASHVLEAVARRYRIHQRPFRHRRHRPLDRLLELADKLRAGLKLPDGAPSTLDVSHAHDGVPSTFPNGCHVCEVEIDPETGVIEVVKYSSVNDFGTIINPLLVEGQVHGGVIQGIGQALLENTVYDERRAIADRLVPGLRDAARPPFADIGFVSHPVPATTNPLGTKGCGEAGCAGALVCVMNAIVDALSVYGISPYRHAGLAVAGVGGDRGGEEGAGGAARLDAPLPAS